MRGNSNDRDIIYLEQMLYEIETIEKLQKQADHYGISRKDEMVILSVSNCLVQMGNMLEKRRLSKNIQDKYQNWVCWEKWKNLRKVLLHKSESVEESEILDVLQNDLPKLKENLQSIIAHLKEVQEEGIEGKPFYHHTATELRLIGDGVLEVDFKDGESRRYDMKHLIPKIPCMKRLVEEEGLFAQGKLSPAGWGIDWDDEVDVDIEEIYINGVAI